MSEAVASRSDLKALYQSVFDNDNGRRVLAHLMKVGNVVSPTVHGTNPCMTYFEEGKRSLVLSIMRQVFRDESALVNELMKQEEQKTE